MPNYARDRQGDGVQVYTQVELLAVRQSNSAVDRLEVDELAELIKRNVPGATIVTRVDDVPTDRAPWIVDALYIYVTMKAVDAVLDEVLSRMTDGVMDSVEACVRKVLKSRKKDSPQYIALLDESDRVTRAWEVVDGELTDRTVRDRNQHIVRRRNKGRHEARP